MEIVSSISSVETAPAMPLKEKIAQPAPKIALAHKTQAAKVACVTVACAFQVSSSVKAQSSLYVRQIARVGHSKRLAPQGATATRPKDNVSPLVVTATVTLRAMKIARPVQKTVSATAPPTIIDTVHSLSAWPNLCTCASEDLDHTGTV